MQDLELKKDDVVCYIVDNNQTYVSTSTIDGWGAVQLGSDTIMIINQDEAGPEGNGWLLVAQFVGTRPIGR